jgi:ABC-type dipeptide/oligopeptide/nickel transport system ATPase component
MDSNQPVVDIQHLRTYFYVRGQIARAVDDVSLTIPSGQTLGLVGESGCGKSVTAHSIIRLISEPPGIFLSFPKPRCEKSEATRFP